MQGVASIASRSAHPAAIGAELFESHYLGNHKCYPLLLALWNCTNEQGGICSAPVWCESFAGGYQSSYNYTDVNFKIKFTLDNEEDVYIRLPIYALMRSNVDRSVPRCDLLVYKTWYSLYDYVVIGESFMQ